MRLVFVLALVLLATPVLAQTPLAAPGHPGWVKVNGKCFVWNTAPLPKEVAHWTGKCVGKFAAGKGILTWRSPIGTARFEGTLRNGKPYGRGVSVSPEGNRYVGDWRDGKQTGRGLFLWTSGSRYEGTWRDGKPEGRGTGLGANGVRYDGDWHDGQANGYGFFVFPDGTLYEGGVRDGKPNGPGRGRVTGEVYSGLWTEGCFLDGDRRAAIMRDIESCP